MKWLLILVIAVGLGLRLYHFESRLAFDFDSEYFAWEAKKILVDHKLTLVGQEASVMGVFIGPLYTYISTLFYALFGMDPVAGSVLAVILGIAATVMLYLTARYLAGGTAGLLAAIFYQWLAFSISWDWSASALNGMFVVPLVWLYSSFRGWWWLTLISVGLAFHLHPTAVILAVATTGLLFWRWREVSRRDWLIGSMGLTALLSPLLLFELRHGGVISRSVVAAVAAGRGGGFDIMARSLVFVNGLGGWLYGPGYATTFRWVGGLTAFLVWAGIKSHRTFGRFWVNYAVLLLTTWLALVIYPGHVTDYYPMLIYGPTMVAVAGGASLVKARLAKALVGAMLMWLMVINLKAWFTFSRPYHLQAKKQVVDWIINHAEGRKFAISDSFISPGYNTGFNYLFWRRGVALEKQRPEIIYSLVIPSWYKAIVPKIEIGGIGIEWGEVIR